MRPINLFLKSERYYLNNIRYRYLNVNRSSISGFNRFISLWFASTVFITFNAIAGKAVH